MASARKDREQRFVEEYLTDLNGARAYTAAGYHAKTPKVAAVCAAKLLARASIANAIQARQKAIAERTNITVEGIVRRLAAIGFGDIRKLFDDKGCSGPSTSCRKTSRPWWHRLRATTFSRAVAMPR